MNAVASSVINGLLSVKPLAKFAKNRARTMMMDRAETLGIYWRDEARALRMRAAASTPLDLRQAEGCEVNAIWEADLKQIENPDLVYPRYYTTSFHAYDEGNLGWLPASEVDVAARAVHARIWPEGDDRAGVNGDASLRASYHQVIANLASCTRNDCGLRRWGWAQHVYAARYFCECAGDWGGFVALFFSDRPVHAVSRKARHATHPMDSRGG